MIAVWLAAAGLAAPVTLSSSEVCAEAVDGLGVGDRAPPSHPRLDLLRTTLDRGEVPVGFELGTILPHLPNEQKPGKDALSVVFEAAPHPFLEGSSYVVGEAVAKRRERPPFPQHITLIVDTGASMQGVVSRAFPALQNEALRKRALDPIYAPTTRLELVKAALVELADNLPSNASVGLIAFDSYKAKVLLKHTPDPAKIKEAVAKLEPDSGKGDEELLEAVVDLVGDSFVPCGDDRVFLFGHNETKIDHNEKVVDKALESWLKAGLQLWGVAIGKFGAETDVLDALVAKAKGGVLRIDNLSEARTAFEFTLRESGAVARELEATVTLPGAWRRAGTVKWHEPSETDTWTAPETLPSMWRHAVLYEVKGLGDASVTWKVGSPTPGEWELGKTQTATVPASWEEAPDLAQRRALTALYLQRTTDPVEWDWPEIEKLADLEPPQGTWAEVRAWIERTRSIVLTEDLKGRGGPNGQ